MERDRTGLILKALNFAAFKHKDQRRKDLAATPYINHPIAIANMLWNVANITDETVIAAALLHDTVEDTQTTFAEIQREFGIEVQNLVQEVTDDKSLPKQTRKQLQIEHAAHISDRAKLIKLADKISNLTDMATSPPADWSLERRQEYFVWAKQVVDRLRGVNLILEDIFDQKYQEGIAKLNGDGNN